ncbi:MAG: type phosphodiesterase/nucleotide pyrophosphatase, partial [Nocardioides sp.]|nr:type phosphodiesterase/nucleotide pyrophosphatase [Nocardioides sp.]
DPHKSRPTYAGAQPVRNGDVANLSTDLLGLAKVPGSELDAQQDLDWN